MSKYRGKKKMQFGGEPDPLRPKGLGVQAQDNTRTKSLYDKVKANQFKVDKENKEKADAEILLVRAGMDAKNAKIQANPRTRLKTSQKLLDEQTNKEYRTRMSQGYDPNKPIEQQYGLANVRGLDQRIYRGANMIMNQDLGNPVLNVAKDVMFAPGKSFVNLSNPVENYVKPGLAQGATNLGMDLLNVAPTMVGEGVSKVAGATKKALAKKSTISSVKGVKDPWKIPDWALEEMKFAINPKLNNPDASQVLENFRTRIKTPEGQKRLKDLGITDTKVFDRIDILSDKDTYGRYWNNKIGLNPELPEFKNVTRHEIEHSVQDAIGNSRMDKYNTDAGNFKFLFNKKAKLKAKEDILNKNSNIDDLLSGIELRKTPEKVDWSIRNNEKPNPSELFNYMTDKQRATNYFDSGSGGREKSAFLSEVQQYMMDVGTIPKTGYTQVTPEMVKNTFVDAMFDEKNNGKYLRMFNIMKSNDKNYNILAKGLNKMLGIVPVVAGGAAASQQKKQGGMINYRGNIRMQMGGEPPKQSDYPDYESWNAAQEEWLRSLSGQPTSPLSLTKPSISGGFSSGKISGGVSNGAAVSAPPIQGGISNGAAVGAPPISGGVTDGKSVGAPSMTGGVTDSSGIGLNPPKKKDPYFLGLGKRMLSTATTGLEWLSGIVERNRQNQYQQNQFSTLGQLDGMPISNFQPSAYNLYSKYGGSISKYRKGGLTPNDARQILHDKEVKNHPLTDKQRRFFGAKSKGHTNYRGNEK